MLNAKVLSLKGTSPRRHYVSKKEEDPWEKHENLLKTCTMVTNKCVRFEMSICTRGEKLILLQNAGWWECIVAFAKHSRVFPYKVVTRILQNISNEATLCG